MSMTTTQPLSPASRYILVCVGITFLIGVLPVGLMSPLLLGAEFFTVILALFFFSSSTCRIDSNIVSYGALPVLLATFFRFWWPTSELSQQVTERGQSALIEAIVDTLFSLERMESLVHADTMLFILGLTFFVNVIVQSRLLEAISLRLLILFKGAVFPTALMIAGLVAILSGILGGVSMSGLLIRVWVIILVMAKLDNEKITFMVVSSGIITTVCGIWLAYGEPPNLIMKSNLGLSDSFFLIYATPLAIASFFVAAFFIYRCTALSVIPLSELDILEWHMADIRFLQAKRGEQMEAEDFMDQFHDQLMEKQEQVTTLYHQGHHPISAMTLAGVDDVVIRAFIRGYLNESFVGPVLFYYHCRHNDKPSESEAGDLVIALFSEIGAERSATQKWGKWAFLPFVVFLVAHAYYRDYLIPLFVSPWAAFFVAFLGIARHAKMVQLSLREAVEECKGYLFLFPLFLSVALLSMVRFFDPIQTAIAEGTEVWGPGTLAVVQFAASGALSALLDNNVVADFFSRAIVGLPERFLFAAAQIAGYAVGGSLTHIGSAQSIVVFSFIRRYLNPNFTPWDWVRTVWRVIAVLSVVLTAVLCLISTLF
jgi:Na+/H+ antiporter NhaD/arsenite permease-like protein